MKHSSLEIRADAHEALVGLTGVNIPFVPNGNIEIRREGIRAWQKWWKEEKSSAKR